MHNKNFQTIAIKNILPNPFNATVSPIIASNAFEAETAEELEKIFEGKSFGYLYSRISNPTVTEVEQRITKLENGIGAIATSTGMAAIAVALLGILKVGDHLIVSNSLFGGTVSLLQNIFSRFGIIIDFVDTTNIQNIEEKFSSSTRGVFIETIGNPKLDIQDIARISKITHEFQIPLFVDNTFATPYLVNCKELGADVIIYSMTKFFSAPSSVLGGIIVDTGNFDWNTPLFPAIQLLSAKIGEFAFLQYLRNDTYRDFGPALSPFNAFLILNGLTTLGLRMDTHCSNALKLAQFLQNHKKVAWVNYPGLPTNTYHNLAKEQFRGQFGALLTFGTGSKEKSFKVIDKLKMSKNLANLGDVNTLVIHPASTIYHDFSSIEKEKIGVTDDMIRVSVGLENIEDILEDFNFALKE